MRKRVAASDRHAASSGGAANSLRAMDVEVPLAGGAVTEGLVRVGDTVRRPLPQCAGMSLEALARLRPWIVRRVVVHNGATMVNGFGAQLVVPGFVVVDLAQPVFGAVH